MSRICSTVSNPCFFRWVSVLLLAIVSSFLIAALKLPINIVATFFLHYSAQTSTTILFVLHLLITYLLTRIIIRTGGLGHSFSCSTMLRYPPYFTSIVLAIIALAFTQRSLFSTADLNFRSISLLVAIPIGFYLPLLLDWVLDCKKENTPSMTIAESSPKFLKWIMNESPIITPEDDLFEFKVQAKRSAKRVLLKKGAPSIALIGPYGAGKSSFFNLLKYYIKNKSEEVDEEIATEEFFNGKVIFAHFDGWGRYKADIAQNVLNVMLGEVKKHVDCCAILSLPENYSKAIGSISKGGAILTTLLNTSFDSTSQLEKLDEILSAGKLRLLLVLEDIDRNSSDDLIKNEIPPLLDRLNKLENISFVMSIGTEHHYSGMIIRICGHEERIG